MPVRPRRREARGARGPPPRPRTREGRSPPPRHEPPSPRGAPHRMTRPVSDGAHSACAPARRAANSTSSTRPNHTIRALGGWRRRSHSGIGSLSRHPQVQRDGGIDPGRRVEQDPESLALLVASHEHHGGHPDRRAGGRREALEVDAVADDVVGPAERVLGGGPRLGRHRTASRQTPRHGARQRGRGACRRCSSRPGETSPPWAVRTPPDRRSRAPVPTARAGARRRIRPVAHSRTARSAAPGPSATGATEPLAGSATECPSRTKPRASRPGTSMSSSAGASTTASCPAPLSAPANPTT